MHEFVLGTVSPARESWNLKALTPPPPFLFVFLFKPSVILPYRPLNAISISWVLTLCIAHKMGSSPDEFNFRN